MNQSPEKEKGMSFIKKAGKWAPLVGGAWIVLNIVVPLALLRIPAVQKYLVVLEDKLPCLLYTSPSPRDNPASRMPSSA